MYITHIMLTSLGPDVITACEVWRRRHMHMHASMHICTGLVGSSVAILASSSLSVPLTFLLTASCPAIVLLSYAHAYAHAYMHTCTRTCA